MTDDWRTIIRDGMEIILTEDELHRIATSMRRKALAEDIVAYSEEKGDDLSFEEAEVMAEKLILVLPDSPRDILEAVYESSIDEILAARTKETKTSSVSGMDAIFSFIDQQTEEEEQEEVEEFFIPQTTDQAEKEMDELYEKLSTNDLYYQDVYTLLENDGWYESGERNIVHETDDLVETECLVLLGSFCEVEFTKDSLSMWMKFTPEGYCIPDFGDL